MSDGAPELFRDPRLMFRDGARAKALQREYLGRIVSGQTEEPLDTIAEEVAARVGPVIAPLIDAAIAEVVAEGGADDAPPRPTASFDGGAVGRAVPTAEPTHAQTLIALVRSRVA